MIKLIHILPNLGAGGAEFLTLNLSKELVRKQFEIIVVTLFDLSRFDVNIALTQNHDLLEIGIKVIHLNKHLGFDLKVLFKLWKVLRIFKPDIVHTHRYVLRYALLPMVLCRVPVRVHTVHNPAQKEVDRFGKLIHWIAFRLARVVPVSISNEIAKSVHSVYGGGIHTPVIYNGIPVQKFLTIPPPMWKEHIVVLHVGRFAPQKNHSLLIDAFAMAIREYPNMQLWLVGDGPLRSRIEKMVREKGLSVVVSFLGIRNDIPNLMEQSDMLVLSSDWEGVPITILEAMASARPVVATSVGGVPELIENGINGLLVPPGGAEALAQAIVKLAKNPTLRSEMGIAGRQKALERFDINCTAREYESLYLQLLKHKRL